MCLLAYPSSNTVEFQSRLQQRLLLVVHGPVDELHALWSSSGIVRPRASRRARRPVVEAAQRAQVASVAQLLLLAIGCVAAHGPAQAAAHARALLHALRLLDELRRRVLG